MVAVAFLSNLVLWECFRIQDTQNQFWLSSLRLTMAYLLIRFFSNMQLTPERQTCCIAFLLQENEDVPVQFSGSFANCSLQGLTANSKEGPGHWQSMTWQSEETWSCGELRSFPFEISCQILKLQFKCIKKHCRSNNKLRMCVSIR